jgi:predicted GNAT family N-acyltransferase
MRTQRISSAETLTLRQAVLRPTQPLSESRFSGDELPLAGHFGAFVERDGEVGELIAVGTVYPEACRDPNADRAMTSNGAWRLRGMATAAEFRGMGAGGLVLQACLEHAKKSGARVVWCNARTGAVPFYLRHGFQKMSGEYELPGIGPHFLMKQDLRGLS